MAEKRDILHEGMGSLDGLVDDLTSMVSMVQASYDLRNILADFLDNDMDLPVKVPIYYRPESDTFVPEKDEYLNFEHKWIELSELIGELRVLPDTVRRMGNPFSGETLKAADVIFELSRRLGKYAPSLEMAEYVRAMGFDKAQLEYLNHADIVPSSIMEKVDRHNMDLVKRDLEFYRDGGMNLIYMAMGCDQEDFEMLNESLNPVGEGSVVDISKLRRDHDVRFHMIITPDDSDPLYICSVLTIDRKNPDVPSYDTDIYLVNRENIVRLGLLEDAVKDIKKQIYSEGLESIRREESPDLRPV
jgi:hypothetical protein